jgi:oligoribonuclease (3'-5' exoribonuclease)
MQKVEYKRVGRVGLKSVKEAYEQACREIDKQIDELQYYKQHK